jgi:hypothetical protein
MAFKLLFAIGAQPSYGAGIIRVKSQRALAAAFAAGLSTLSAARSRFGFQPDDVVLSSAASLASIPYQYQEEQNSSGRNSDHPSHVYSTSDMCRLFVQNSYKTIQVCHPKLRPQQGLLPPIPVANILPYLHC